MVQKRKNRDEWGAIELMHNENIAGTARHTVVNFSDANNALAVYQMFNDTRGGSNYSAGIGLASSAYNQTGGLGANSGVFAILAPGDGGFIHHYDKDWIWKMNPDDDGLLANVIEYMRLKKTALVLENGVLQIKEITTPTAVTDYGQLYTKTDNIPYFQDGDGDENIINTKRVSHCAITKSADQSISSGSWTSLSFNTEIYDVNSMHDNVTNNTRVTIPVTGQYRINYHIKYEIGEEQETQSRIYKNGSAEIAGLCDINYIDEVENSVYSTLQNTSYLVDLVVDDYIELQFRQDNGGSKDVKATETWFEVQRVYQIT